MDKLKVLSRSGYTWENKRADVFFLSDGSCQFEWFTDDNKTAVRLSATAVHATFKALADIQRETGKPIGWNPDEG